MTENSINTKAEENIYFKFNDITIYASAKFGMFM